jgi:histone deacetylase 1/2
MVIQCGADSISKDKLGHLNLSIKGHGELLTYMKSFGTPMVLLGGGGYTIENVARCWTYETGLMVGSEIENEIPKHDSFYNFYGKEVNKIHFDVDPVTNNNEREYLDDILETIYENLKEAEIRPCVGFHSAPRHYTPTE